MNISRISRLSVCALISLLLMTGCWDAYEIKDYTMISLVGIDREDSRIKFFLEYNQLYQQSADSQDAKKKSMVLMNEAENFTEGRNAHYRRDMNEPFLGTIRCIVFSDSFSKHGIEEYLNRIRGEKGYGKTFPLFTTTSPLELLFNSKDLNIQNIGVNIEKKMMNLLKHSMAYKSDIVVTLENALVSRAGYVINNLDIVDDAIEINGYSIFNNNKKIGFLPADQMKVVNYLILDKAFSQLTFDFEGIKAGMSVKVKSKDIRPQYDGKNIIFNVKVNLKAEILHFSKAIKLDNEKLSKLENVISHVVKQEIENAIEISQEQYECDYLFFYKAFRAKYNSDFINMNWNGEYKNAKFNITVDTSVVTGNLLTYE